MNSTDTTCYVKPEPDISGPGLVTINFGKSRVPANDSAQVRISTVVPVVAVYILAVADLFIQGGAHSGPLTNSRSGIPNNVGFRNDIRKETKKDRIRKAIALLNSLQFVTSLLALLTTSIRQGQIPEYHIHFILNASGLTCWSLVITLILVKNYLAWSTSLTRLPAGITFLTFTLLLLVKMVQYVNYTRDHGQSNCVGIDHPYLAIIIVYCIFLFTELFLLTVCSQLALRRNGRNRWPWSFLERKVWFQASLLTPPGFGIAISAYMALGTHSESAYVLNGPEDQWNFGQVMSLGLVCAGTAHICWHTFEIEGVSPG